jgi:hypothetical protein
MYDNAEPHLDADGQVVFLVGRNGGHLTSAVDARSGASLGELPREESLGSFHRAFPLEKGQLCYQSNNLNELVIWDPLRKHSERSRHPQPPGDVTIPMLNPSPNGRYLAVSRARPQRETDPYPESRLQVLDAVTGKAVVSADWRPGTTAFTGDSSRVLVVDATDRFRWFRLPGNEAETEWRFDQPPTAYNANVLSVSADGGVILYEGRLPGRERTHFLLNGKTGEVLHEFPRTTYLGHRGFLSEDGKMVALVRTDGLGPGHTVEVLDGRGARIGKIPIPQNKKITVVTANWKSRTLIVYERDNRKLWAYDLPRGP